MGTLEGMMLRSITNKLRTCLKKYISLYTVIIKCSLKMAYKLDIPISKYWLQTKRLFIKLKADIIVLTTTLFFLKIISIFSFYQVGFIVLIFIT